MTVARDEQSSDLPDGADGRPDSGAVPTPGQSLRAMWTYSVLRFGMFGVIWLVLWLARVEVYLAALIAIVLSVPLSYVLLRRQRDRLALNIERRVDNRRAQQGDLDAKLSADRDDERGPSDR